MNEKRLYQRVAHRERHRSRSTAIVFVLILVILGAAYLGIECVLAALGDGPLLVSPAEAIRWLGSGEIVVTIVAVVVAVLGFVLVLIAVLPGRRARHSMPSDRMAVIVDDRVIAGAFARQTRHIVELPASRVHADVSSRVARVVVTPVSGVAVDVASARAAADQLLARLSPSPRMRAKVTVQSSGTVGS